MMLLQTGSQSGFSNFGGDGSFCLVQVQFVPLFVALVYCPEIL